jgi:membrane protease YdiL (CAAX protease family)
MRNKTVFSILVPLAFLVLHFGIRQLPKAGSSLEWVLSRQILPLLLAAALIWWLHGRRLGAVPDAWGLKANALEAFKMAFVFCLPMLLGYAFLADFNISLTLNGFLVGCLWAALSEELFFRGFVFGQLFRFAGWGFLLSGLLNALVFGSAHLYQAGDLGSAMGIFAITALGGLWFAWLYIEWGNNLWMPMAMHFFMNLWWNAFEAGPNAGGGLAANLFRAATIAFSIIWTIGMKRRKGLSLEITRNRWLILGFK